MTPFTFVFNGTPPFGTSPPGPISTLLSRSYTVAHTRKYCTEVENTQTRRVLGDLLFVKITVNYCTAITFSVHAHGACCTSTVQASWSKRPCLPRDGPDPSKHSNHWTSAGDSFIHFDVFASGTRVYHCLTPNCKSRRTIVLNTENYNFLNLAFEFGLF